MKLAILATAATILVGTLAPGLAQAQTRAEMRRHHEVHRIMRHENVGPREARRIAERRMHHRMMERRMERRMAERRMERAERRHERAVRRMHREMRHY